MSFGRQMRAMREQKGLARAELAARLGVTPSAVSNYENGTSFPKEDVLLRLFDALQTEPNALFCDSYRAEEARPAEDEALLLRHYRALSGGGRRAALAMLAALEEALAAEDAG